MAESSIDKLLKSVQQMAGSIKSYVSGQLYFSGLHDTPTGYLSGYYVRANETGIEYIHPTGVAKELSEHLGAGDSTFTGLQDTPTGYISGYYLRSSETGIEYLSPQDLADDVADEIVQTLVTGKLMAFTGLYDTPTGYQSGYYLESTATGISYIDPTGLARKIPTIPNAYDFVPEDMEDGEIIKVGCDIYLSCNGEWKNLGSPGAPEIENLPGCVTNLSQAVEYQEYKEEFLAQNMGNTFDQMLNSDTDISDSIYNVCLFSNESNSTVKIDETTYKWGMFSDTQTVNITATPGTTSDREIVFSRWAGDGAVFGNANSSQTTLLVDKDLSVTGYFSAPTTFTLLQTITAPDASISDQFGCSVSVDGTQMMVGSFLDDDAGDSTGSVYVYELINNTWTYQTKITSPDPSENDRFGVDVSVDGAQMVVGEYFHDSGSGAVHVYELINNTWTHQTTITTPDGSHGVNFGESVSVDGTKMMVGAGGNDDAGTNAGAVYVYELINNTWTYQTKITAPDPSSSAHFGVRVSLDGTQMVVGAWNDDDAGDHAGSVYVYKLINNTWTYQTKITAPDAAQGDYFGASVSVDGTLMMVGAYGNDDVGQQTGSVYVYALINNIWTYEKQITASNASAFDFFGASVSIDGTRFVAGSPGRNSNRGSVYVYSLS